MSTKTATISLTLLAITLTLTLSSAHARYPAYLQRYDELPLSIIPNDVQMFGCNNQLTDDAEVSGDNNGIKPIPFISDGAVKMMFSFSTFSWPLHLSVRVFDDHCWMFEPILIFGNISGDFGSTDSKFYSFDKQKSDSIEVIQGTGITLSQSNVIVPKGAIQEQIEAHIKRDKASNPADEIADGVVSFSVKKFGFETKIIKGKDGFIKVNAFWGLPITRNI
uniref:Uncharacterized protein n=1 Tax=Chenopodium quinoa TaxID=63459 RepID=A0A803MYE4_CHEQI